MDVPRLTDKNEYPDDRVLARSLGKAVAAWAGVIKHLDEVHPTWTREWRYYNDGKRWLCKIQSKKKTVCWISVWQSELRVGFYFTDKAEPLIDGSRLGKPYKAQFHDRASIGKLKPVRVSLKSTRGLKAVAELMEIKDELL